MPGRNIAVIEDNNLSGEYDRRYVVINKDSVKCREPFNAALVKKMLKENNLVPDFTAGELLRVFQKGEK